MAGGKQTPRQKMIGMMYLVLTALLALNVSAEILNAFVLIDNSLRKTVDNFSAKNDKVYAEFEKAFQENQSKTKPWKDKADKVKKSSQELIGLMSNIKEELTKGDPGGQKFVEEKFSTINIQKKDENNVPSEIMIFKGRGAELKTKIDAFHADMLALIDAKEQKGALAQGIGATLNTDPIKDEEGNELNWDLANFKGMPMVAVVTVLSKMQNDIKNVETDMITYLLSKIDAGSFKFNKIEAIVNSPSNYVLVGGKYEAKVFIAASDSTQDPQILVNGVGKLPVTSGKGVFSGGTGSVGLKQWGGVIKMISPATKDTLEFPFKSEYTVAEASISVSPTKMNVFYIGVANPVDITASGVPADKVQASINSGTLKQIKAGSYEVFVKQTGKVSINVSFKTEDGQTKNLGSKEFRVKTVPDPIATIGSDPINKKGGLIGMNLLLAQSGVKAELENFDFDLRFDVTNFVVSATIRGFEEEAKSSSNAFTAAQKDLIRKAGIGKKVYIEDVMAKGPDGTIRKLGALSFKLK